MNFIRRKLLRLYVNYLRRQGDDVTYHKMHYFLRNGRYPDLKNPREFMEKISWLKLFHYKEDCGKFVDKYDVREFVSERVGPQILNEVFKVYDSADEINLSELPDKFVLKCTHASGTNIIVKDKSKLNWDEAKAKLNKWMHTNYFNRTREYVYKDVEPRIIAEKYLSAEGQDDLTDYKFYCFHGKPRYILVKMMSNGKMRKCYYDMQWNKIHPEKANSDFLADPVVKPVNFDEMCAVAEKLADGFIFMRVDLYEIAGKTLFGEMTFFPTGGLKRIFVEKLNNEMGDLIILPGR